MASAHVPQKQYLSLIFQIYKLGPKSAFSAGTYSLPLTSSAVRPDLTVESSVLKYNTSSGNLLLEHKCVFNDTQTIGGEPPSQCTFSVVVNVNLLLDTLTWSELEVGAWLNVLGYVRDIPCMDEESKKALKGLKSVAVGRYVEAVMVFPAGAIHIDEYERVLKDSQEVERRYKKGS